MKAHIGTILVLILGVGLGATLVDRDGRPVAAAPTNAGTHLAIVWTSGDPEVAHKMAFMYLHASQKQSWFDENLLIVWGPSSRLLVQDETLQAKVAAMREDGVRVQACIACANMYGVADDLRKLGIEVKPMGAPLSQIQQNPAWHVMTF